MALAENHLSDWTGLRLQAMFSRTPRPRACSALVPVSGWENQNVCDPVTLLLDTVWHQRFSGAPVGARGLRRSLFSTALILMGAWTDSKYENPTRNARKSWVRCWKLVLEVARLLSATKPTDPCPQRFR